MHRVLCVFGTDNAEILVLCVYLDYFMSQQIQPINNQIYIILLNKQNNATIIHT